MSIFQEPWTNSHFLVDNNGMLRLSSVWVFVLYLTRLSLSIYIREILSFVYIFCIIVRQVEQLDKVELPSFAQFSQEK